MSESSKIAKVGNFITKDHPYLFLGTSVIAAIGIGFSMQLRSPKSYLTHVFSFEVAMYWFLVAWLVVSGVALLWKLTHWNNYRETCPLAQSSARTFERWVSYIVCLFTCILVVDRVGMSLSYEMDMALAQDTNPNGFFGSIIYMLSKSSDIIAHGTLITVELAIFGTCIAFVLAILLVFLRVQTIDRCDNDAVRFFKHLGRGFAKTYSTVVRGTPMMVQAMLIYFAGFGILKNSGMTVGEIGAVWSTFIASLVTISLNSAAYMMEVMRGGIEAVDPGQNEAARSLGLSQWKTMIKVVFPQGIKNAVPALSNELIINIKDSSVLSVIGVFDLMFATKTVVGIYFKQVELYVVAACIYLCLTMIASFLLNKLSHRLNVEPQTLHSSSDMEASLGTIATTESSSETLQAKKVNHKHGKYY